MAGSSSSFFSFLFDITTGPENSGKQHCGQWQLQLLLFYIFYFKLNADWMKTDGICGRDDKESHELPQQALIASMRVIIQEKSQKWACPPGSHVSITAGDKYSWSLESFDPRVECRLYLFPLHREARCWWVFVGFSFLSSVKKEVTRNMLAALVTLSNR